MLYALTITNTHTGFTFTERFPSAAERSARIEWLKARGHYTWKLSRNV